MPQKDIDIFYPKNQQDWRDWLIANHKDKKAVWLVQYKKKANMPTIAWTEAVDEALCFGWIDSIRKSLDDDKFIQYFGKRKPVSTWSKINKEKILQLIDKGLMTEAGYKTIETAKENGSWAILDEVEELTIPEDLAIAFQGKPGSIDFFLGLSKSVKKSILQWLVFAKREETRRNRINEIVEMADQKLKPKQFR